MLSLYKSFRRLESKVNIKVCTGALCHVRRGAELRLIKEHLPDDLRDRVEISDSPCFDVCNQSDKAEAPFVMVGKRVISQANIIKIIVAVREELEK